jgi:tetratricopeptide (TPR) repeat protein
MSRIDFSDEVSAMQADKEPIDQLHAMDYLVYAYLQLGQDAKAREVVDDMNTVAGVEPNFFPGPYALAASPARYMIERGDWKGAAELQLRPTPLAHVEAITHFARALGAARTGNPEAAKAEIAKLAELRDKLREAKDAYWAEQVDIQGQVATAWMLYAEGKFDGALKAMSAAADAEDRTEKHPVTPGVPEPARELYGVMLLERGMAAEALAAFEATIKKEPNRFNAFAGAAKAADRLGDKNSPRMIVSATAPALTTLARPPTSRDSSKSSDSISCRRSAALACIAASTSRFRSCSFETLVAFSDSPLR